MQFASSVATGSPAANGPRKAELTIEPMVRAAMDGLSQLTTVEQVARERGIEVSSIQYRSRAKSKEAV